MMEIGLELLLSFIDYCVLLYCYLFLLSKKWNWKKAISYILIISFIQLLKDKTMDFGGWSLFVDCFLVVGFLYCYHHKQGKQNLVSALLVYSIFKCAITIFVASAIEVNVDVKSALVYGVDRCIFSAVLKVFIIVLYAVLINPMKHLQQTLSLHTINVLSLIVSFILIVISFVYGNSVGNESILIYVLFTLVLFIFILYLVYRYSVALKENEYLNLMNQAKEFTVQYAKNLEQEHEQIKKIKHDMKNQLYVLSGLQRDKRYDEVEQMLSTLTAELEHNKTSISGNIYVDAILRQKQMEYKDILFDLSILLSKDFYMEATDLISLLSNIIDNACEELRRIEKHQFQLTLKGNKSTLQIIEINECRSNLNLKTDKNASYHGYGLKIIQEITDKYDGEIQIEMDKQFHLNILLLL